MLKIVNNVIELIGMSYSEKRKNGKNKTIVAVLPDNGMRYLSLFRFTTTLLSKSIKEFK